MQRVVDLGETTKCSLISTNARLVLLTDPHVTTHVSRLVFLYRAEAHKKLKTVHFSENYLLLL